MRPFKLNNFFTTFFISANSVKKCACYFHISQYSLHKVKMLCIHISMLSMHVSVPFPHILLISTHFSIPVIHIASTDVSGQDRSNSGKSARQQHVGEAGDIAMTEPFSGLRVMYVDLYIG